MKTIKQIADEIGVSKQAVQKRIAREPFKTSMQAYIVYENGVKYIDEDGVNRIIQVFKKSASTSVHMDTAIDAGVDKNSLVYSEMVNLLKQQIEDLKEDKMVLQGKNDELHTELAAERQYSREQIATLTAALVSEQALHAGTLQKQLGGGQLDEAPTDDIKAENSESAKSVVEPVEKSAKPGILKMLFSKKKQ